MSFYPSICALVALTFVTFANAQTSGTIFIHEAGVAGAIEPLQENGTTVFCPTKYDGGFNLECTHPGTYVTVKFEANGKLLREERVAPFFVAGNNAKNVAAWTDWKKHVDAKNVLTLTCITPGKAGPVRHTSKIKFACPPPPKENCVTITAEDVIKDSLGMVSGQWKAQGQSLVYTGASMKKKPSTSELEDEKVAISFPFIAPVTKQNLCVFDVTTTTKANEVAFFLKSDSGFGFSTNQGPIDAMLTRTWTSVVWDKTNMGLAKVGTKMYPLITASLREGMSVNMYLAGKAKGMVFHKMVCVECDGDICTPDKAYVKKALSRCGL